DGIRYDLVTGVQTCALPILIEAEANDTDGTVSRVEFYAGSTLLGTATVPPYNYAWQNVPVGDYSLTAKAIDDKGATGVSEPVNKIGRASCRERVTTTVEAVT